MLENPSEPAAGNATEADFEALRRLVERSGAVPTARSNLNRAVRELIPDGVDQMEALAMLGIREPAFDLRM
jgi:hypothetical protein